MEKGGCVGNYHRAPLLRRKRLRVPPMLGGNGSQPWFVFSVMLRSLSADPSPRIGGGGEGATAVAGFHRAPLLRRKRLRVPPMLGGNGFRKIGCFLLPCVGSFPRIGGRGEAR